MNDMNQRLIGRYMMVEGMENLSDTFHGDFGPWQIVALFPTPGGIWDEPVMVLAQDDLPLVVVHVSHPDLRLDAQGEEERASRIDAGI